MPMMKRMESTACARHLMTHGEYTCSDCGGLFCAECVVHPFNESAPMCITCGLQRGGVRHTDVGHPVKGRYRSTR